MNHWPHLLQCSAVQGSAAHYTARQWYGMVWCGVVLCCVVGHARVAGRALLDNSATRSAGRTTTTTTRRNPEEPELEGRESGLGAHPGYRYGKRASAPDVPPWPAAPNQCRTPNAVPSQSRTFVCMALRISNRHHTRVTSSGEGQGHRASTTPLLPRMLSVRSLSRIGTCCGRAGRREGEGGCYG